MNQPTRIAYIISNIDRWIPFEWIFSSFANSDICIDFILLSSEKGYFYRFIKERKGSIHWLQLKSKADYFKIIPSLIRILKKEDYKAIHCHFLDANICGLIAGWLSGIKKRIYTRHHSTFHHVYAKKGILIDKMCNYLATDIIAISKNVKSILMQMEHVSEDKICLIPHGFDLDNLKKTESEKIERIKKKYNVSKNDFVIGTVSRFIEWKGVQYVIPAFKKYLEENTDALLLLVNARGNYYSDILDLLKDVSESRYRIIPFEEDIFSLFKCFNIFIHVPVDATIEAFGQIYIEAMALGIPSIFTNSGIAPEIVENKKNAYNVPFRDSESVYQAILELSSKETQRILSKNAKSTNMEEYELLLMINRLKKLYTSK